MKLQINSLEALERLIGGDTEVEIEIRNNIVQEFTKKHLKALINTDIVEGVGHKLSGEIESTAIKSIADIVADGRWSTKLVLKQSIVDEISERAKRAASIEVSEAISVAVYNISQKYTDDYVNALIDQRIDSAIDETIKKGVANKLAAIANTLK